MADTVMNVTAAARSSTPGTGPAPARSNGAEVQGRGRGSGRGRGPRGGRGRARGQGRSSIPRGHQNDGAIIGSDAGRPPGGFGARLTEAASKIQDDLQVNEEAREAAPSLVDDGEICFICASPIEHIAIAPCNHQTCHICSLRLRALYKTRACAHCRTEAPFVVFTDSGEKRFENFEDSEFIKIDDNLGIKYEKDDILEDTILLLRYNCPDPSCDIACLGWPDLHRHVKSKHGRVMCDLCTRNKKVFTHEHELFTFGELRRHEKSGDDKPGAEDQSGFKGHPECGFCRQRFYGDDELYTHCREKHERCHICDRRDGGRNPQYYLNYEQLEKHFADQHFVCQDAECQANKTNVFESEMDLKAHQISEHPNGISKGREGRLVNLSGFNLREQYQPPPRRGGRDREARGTGRGRDPNAEPLPMSSAMPLSRAELAYQRQMALQNAQPNARTFGGALSAAPAPAPTQSRSQPAATTTSPTPTNPISSFDNLAVDSTTDLSTLSPSDRARALRHTAVIQRATALLQDNQTKLSQFRTHISAYRSGTMSAADLIDSFFSLFDCPSAELGKLIRELADLYDDKEKQRALLEAWQNWRSINEDYPSLPGPSGTLPGTLQLSAGGNTTSHGRRVLKLKNSTAQSGRAAVSRVGGWGTALSSSTGARINTGTSSYAPPSPGFPSLPSAVSSTTTGPSSRPAPVPTWLPSGNTQGTGTVTLTTTSTSNPNHRSGASATLATRTAHSPARPPPTMSQRKNEELFPSLPKAAKPNVMMAGFNTRGSGKWGSNPNSNSGSAWASGTVTPRSGAGATTSQEVGQTGGPAIDAAADALAADLNDGNGKSKKKGKGRKGETLFHFG